MADTTAEVTERIAASPASIYALVSDLPRMGEWSPENRGGKWLDGASEAAVGARFRGHNKKGVRRWSTICTITSASPGERFGFHVSTGPLAVADWTYELRPDGDATVVTERWVDRRPGWMVLLSGPVMGVVDRATYNREGMRQTLAAVKGCVEAG